jgi:hypothetical protein
VTLKQRQSFVRRRGVVAVDVDDRPILVEPLQAEAFGAGAGGPVKTCSQAEQRVQTCSDLEKNDAKRFVSSSLTLQQNNLDRFSPISLGKLVKYLVGNARSTIRCSTWIGSG